MPAPHLSTRPVAEVELLTEWIVAHVQTVLPAAGGEVARAAVGAAATGARGMAALRDHLERHPDTLTVGHPDVAPVMCKFIRALADAGTGAVLPVCSRCHQPAKRLPKPIDGGRICSSCVDRENAEPCSARPPARHQHQHRHCLGQLRPNRLDRLPRGTRQGIACLRSREVGLVPVADEAGDDVVAVNFRSQARMA